MPRLTLKLKAAIVQEIRDQKTDREIADAYSLERKNITSLRYRLGMGKKGKPWSKDRDNGFQLFKDVPLMESSREKSLWLEVIVEAGRDVVRCAQTESWDSDGIQAWRFINGGGNWYLACQVFSFSPGEVTSLIIGRLHRYYPWIIDNSPNTGKRGLFLNPNPLPGLKRAKRALQRRLA